MEQENLLDLQGWVFSFLKFFNVKLVDNFSAAGWIVAVMALVLAYDWAKLANGKWYRISGLLHDILKLTFISMTLAVSFVAVSIVAPIPGSIAEIKEAISKIEIPDPIDPNQELKAENDRLKRQLGALEERNARLGDELQQAQQRDLDMLTQRLIVAYMANETSEDSVTQIVVNALGNWSSSYESMRFVLRNGNSPISVTCVASRGACRFGD